MHRQFAKLLLPQKLRNGGYLSSWSPIAAAFNQKPPPVTDELKGLFDVPDLDNYQGFYEVRDHCIKAVDCLIDEATSETRKRKMVEIFDELSDTLCKVADLSEFIRLAHPASKYRDAAENASAAVSGVVEKLNTNRKLYDALNNVVQNGDIIPTTETDNHVANLFLVDFKLSGIHLPKIQRGKVVQLNNYLLQLGQQFVAESSRPRLIHKDKIPAFAQHIFPMEGSHVIVSGLNADSVIPEVRELAYRIYLHPDSEQEALLTELLRARQELAVTCGFKNFAEKALIGSIVQSPGMVTQFLDKLSENLRPRADKDFQLMHAMKQEEHTSARNLAPWDIPYYTQMYKRDRFQVASVDFTPYFSLGACMDGLNILLNNLYGISLVIQPIGKGECWHDDVYKLAVEHVSEGLLGYIYCDFFERTGKPNQDCHFTIRGGKNLVGGYQLPIVVLMLNLPQRRFGSPTLLTPGMVDNLFHEMGHAMHSMLARTQYQHVTGTRCSTDFAEVPSVLMEYFASDPRVIRTFAKHFQTSEVIPEEMLQRLCSAKHVFVASEMQIQLFYSALDQCYHNEHPLHGSTTDILSKVQSKYYNLPYVNHTAWQLRFSHLVGYGAKYYSYLFSTALASRIWHTYFKDDPLSRSQGEYYRRECLAHGGGKPPWKLVSDFLQKEPTPTLLADALINDIDTKNAANL